MRFWVGVTDNKWFSFLSGQPFDEVNFWQPSAKPPFVNAPTGMPFLFKLKMPYRAIAGGGFFVTYSRLPTTLAWEVFGPKNGAESLTKLRALLDPLMDGDSLTKEIGCTVLANPFFLPPDQWLDDPPGWSSNIVRGKMYDSETFEGAAIWRQLGWHFMHAPDDSQPAVADSVIRDAPAKYGEPVLVRPRLGQSSFRVVVTDAYKRRCAMTGESTLVALEAAHILPFADEGTHEVRNGMLLRADFHRLFDVGLVGVTPDYRIKVSRRIREAWFNGKIYYGLDGKPLTVLPDRPTERPDREFLEWHMTNRFQS